MALRGPERALRRLEWTVIRRLDGLLQGDYRTLFRGFGLDLADLREYQLHDDVRHIDWNATARLQVPYVRQYHEDRETCAWFLVDLSGSMDLGAAGVRKRDVAADFVGVVSRLLARHGNRVGAMLFDERVEAVIPARTGTRHLLHLLERIDAVGRGAGARRAPVDGTDLGDLLAAAGRMVRRRAVVFVVSDFIARAGWVKPLAQLSRRHEVIAVRVVDPLERALPDVGLMVFEDAETGEQLLVDADETGFARRFARAAERREQALREALARSGVDALELSTDDDLVDAIAAFAAMRRRHGRAGSAGGPAGAGRAFAEVAAGGAAAGGGGA